MSCKNPEDCSVLMAEDDQLLMLLMGMQLEVDGVKFCSAASGYQFLELLRSHHATLLILDIAMPGLSGFDIVDRIKSESQLESYRSANLIIHTSHDLTIADQRRLSLGNTVFFTKTSCDNLARVVDAMRRGESSQQEIAKLAKRGMGDHKMHHLGDAIRRIN